MQQRGQAYVLVAYGVVKLKVLVEETLLAIEADLGLAVAGPSHRDGMRRAVHVLNGVLALDRRLDAKLFKSSRGLARVFERVHIFYDAVLARGERAKIDRHFHIPIRRHWDHAKREYGRPHVFE